MHRVAVTGMGLKSPAGNTPEDAFATVLAGKGTAVHLPALLEAAVPVTFGCAVTGFDPDAYFPRARQRHLDRPTRLAVAAAADARTDAGLPDLRPEDDEGDPRTGVFVGTGGAHTSYISDLGALPRERLPVASVPMIMPNATAARISIRHGLQGPCLTFSCACASAAVALGEAMTAIRYGRVDAAVAGGVEAMLSPFAVAAFARINALSRRADAPHEASRPFDRDRDGFVMAEAAAFLMLERMDLAVARGARIHGELAGYAAGADAGHIVQPLDDGRVAARTMRAALADAGVRPEEVGHVNAHATATTYNDRAEARAIAACFPAGSPPVTATKGVTGHLLGSGGAVEAIFALLAASRGTVPPTANFTGGPDATSIDVVHTAPRGIAPAPVLSNSFGFGGHSASLVFRPA
ncbi:3-oxoacyl-[acyl-carrier-protein] synthase II [Actinocorallia herbida]|uniref:3-oxoacyl-[acyl-carrier-protein] synthase II n=1 Tax=Actinocorallia herbida TaxID=58109 RepID=A0A3N1CSY8_9ACTN|nr:beta-ketoacyl-[acyl-carrier-protein] synthase family protein [Actinocorallia herbida]ROO84420.1 3-oxoacyl-[acyl-carrier-protein] synthase II [Actinocorallia herbida]